MIQERFVIAKNCLEIPHVVYQIDYCRIESKEPQDSSFLDTVLKHWLQIDVLFRKGME